MERTTRVPTFTEKQQLLYDAVVSGRRSVFFTGGGGTGKSFIVSHIVRALRAELGADSVAVTASTGRAAFNIQGTTLHKFAGLGLAEGDAESLVSRARYNNKVKKRWKSTRVLIVDEISMVSGEFFDKLEYVARRLRSDSRPFGGLQLVLIGDLLQLPPVNAGRRVLRVFQATAWDRCVEQYVCLDTVFRQRDMEFIRALTCIRLGVPNDIVLDLIQKVSRPVTYPAGMEAVNLYATRSRADTFNSRKLAALGGETQIYTAVDRSGDSRGAVDSLLSNCPAPGSLELRVGAQVMLVRNVNSTLVNGTVGTVVQFGNVEASAVPTRGNRAIPIVRFTLADGRMLTRPVRYETWELKMPDGQLQCSRQQLPLILAWAVTIHKSQGQTIQRLRVDLDGIFEAGQVYTALSRAVGIDTLEVLNFAPDKVAADPDCLEFCKSNDLI